MRAEALGDLLIEARPGFACGEDPPDGVLQFRMNNVTREGRIDLTKKRRVPPTSRKLNDFLLKEGDVLFNATNSPELVGKTAFVSALAEPAVFSNHFLRLRPNDALADGRYLALWLQKRFIERAFETMCRQWVGQATVNREQLLNERVPVPPLPEQRRIADILDRAETLRAQRRQALAQLDALGEAIFLEMFGEPVSNSRHLPESLCLGDVADVVSGITKGRPLRGQNARAVPYLAVANVQDRRLDLQTVKIIEATDAEIKRYRLVNGDLLLTEGGDPDKLGRGTLWHGELPECIHQNHVFRVRLTNALIRPLFLNWLVGSQRGKRFFLRSAKQTTGIASINMTQLRSFPLLVPPVESQIEFERRLHGLERLRSAQLASASTIDALFTSLQHRAFRCEL